MHRTTTGFAAVVLIVAAATSVVVAQAPAGRGVDAEIARVRDATAAFKSLDRAVSAGYARDAGQCVAHPSLGAMGFHHQNAALLDARLEVERPEMLVYERLADGAYRLNGVEYIVPFSAWPEDREPPAIMGQRLKPAPSLSLWYLHVWIWRENPSGVFADWHPDVRCSSADESPERPDEVRRKAIQRLDPLVGNWRGSGWSVDPSGRRIEFALAQTVRRVAGGTVLLMEGRGTAREPDGREVVTHDGVVFVSYDEVARQYRWQGHDPPWGAIDATPRFVDGNLEWSLQNDGTTVRFTLSFGDGSWREVGEASADGGRTWNRFMEMRVMRANGW